MAYSANQLSQFKSDLSSSNPAVKANAAAVLGKLSVQAMPGNSASQQVSAIKQIVHMTGSKTSKPTTIDRANSPKGNAKSVNFVEVAKGAGKLFVDAQTGKFGTIGYLASTAAGAIAISPFLYAGTTIAGTGGTAAAGTATAGAVGIGGTTAGLATTTSIAAIGAAGLAGYALGSLGGTRMTPTQTTMPYQGNFPYQGTNVNPATGGTQGIQGSDTNTAGRDIYTNRQNYEYNTSYTYPTITPTQTASPIQTTTPTQETTSTGMNWLPIALVAVGALYLLKK